MAPSTDQGIIYPAQTDLRQIATDWKATANSINVPLSVHGAQIADLIDAAAGTGTVDLTDAAMAAAVGTTGSASRGAVDIRVEAKVEPIRPGNGARAVGKGELLVNVLDYGAVGNGAVDDRAAILAALAATPVGGVLWFPPGTYALSSELVINKAVTVTGDGAATLKLTAATTNMAQLSTSGITVHGLRFDGNSNGGILLNIQPGITDTTVTACTFTGANHALSAIGVRVRTGCHDTTLRDNQFDGVATPISADGSLNNNAYRLNKIRNWKQRGIYVNGTATGSCNNLRIEDNEILDLLGDDSAVRQPIGVFGNDAMPHRAVRMNRNTVIGPHRSYTAASNKGTADQISAHRCVGLEVVGNYSEGGGDMGITIAQQCQRVVVAQNVVVAADVSGICLGSSASVYTQFVTVTGNILWNNGQNRAGGRNPDGRVGIRCYNAANVIADGNIYGDGQATKTQLYGMSFTNTTTVRASNMAVTLGTAEFSVGSGSSGLTKTTTETVA